MMIQGQFKPIGLGIVAVLIFVTGCRSTTSPVEFYTLTPLATPEEADAIAVSAKNLAIGVGPLNLPKIIDRPQIVTRVGPNKINVDEFRRWAGSVYEDFLRALTINLSTLIPSSMVVAYPWEDYFEPNYRVYLEVRQFDGRLGQYAELDITWAITGRESRDLLLARKSLIKENVPTEDFDALVAAQSRILATLGRQIAQGIKEVHGGK
jgi:uncharacterized lipoprotein YmbA